MRKKTTPLYGIGQLISVEIGGRSENMYITNRVWNGFTWMYRFRGADFSCGECYLRPVIELEPTNRHSLYLAYQDKVIDAPAAISGLLTIMTSADADWETKANVARDIHNIFEHENSY